MRIIALDTAAAVLSLALSTEKGQWYCEIDAGLRHSELLMDAVDMLIKAAGLKPGDLELAACMKGPGSFTGLRIGFAAAKGLALALGIPLVSVPTLDCMALPFSAWPGPVLPVIDAKKGRYFTALYRGGERISEYMDAGPETILSMLPRDAPLCLTGPDAELILPGLRSVISETAIFVDPLRGRGKARELLELTEKSDILKINKKEFLSGPLYLRKSDAELHFKHQS
jgi:tRNA threonylcarbamoyladenosine biosynthesis protein TsaB